MISLHHELVDPFATYREAWRLLRAARGETTRVRSTSPEAQAAALTADQVLARPRLLYNLPLILGVTQLALLLVAADSLRAGWTAGRPGWLGLPGELWLFGLWGLAIGVWGVFNEQRKLRPPELTLALALCAVRKEMTRFPFVPWDWWGYVPLLLALGLVLWLIAGLPEAPMRLAAGAFSAGYALGVTPLHWAYARPWRLAWRIIRQMRAAQGA